ncbi:MAG: hypothetical protein JNM56_11060 [Planctomycetia bacterium]|nr:hypothetical protein [Planctomycetia bacterium]
MRGRFPNILALIAATALLLQPLACACIWLHADEVSSQMQAQTGEPACPHCGGAFQPSNQETAAPHSDHGPAKPCPCCTAQHPHVEVVLAAKVKPLADQVAAGFQVPPLTVAHLPTVDSTSAFLSHTPSAWPAPCALRALLCCWLI